MANVTYTFRFPGRYVGQTVSVYDQSGTQVTTGTVDVNGELAVSLPAGDYAVRTADGKYIHGDPAFGSSAPSVEQAGLTGLVAPAARRLALLQRTTPLRQSLVDTVAASPPTVGAAATASAIASGVNWRSVSNSNGTVFTINRNLYAYRGGNNITVFGSAYPNYFYVCAKSITDPVNTNSAPFCVDFMFDGTTLELQYKGTGSNFRIRVDGELVSATPTNPAADGNLYYLPLTFATRATRRITVEGDVAFTWGGAVTGPNDSIWKPDVRSPRCIVIGDSFTDGTGATGKAATNWVRKFGEAMGWPDTWASGLGGTGYLNPGTGGRVKFRDRIASDCLNYNPDVVVLAGGINDTTSNTSAIQTEVTTLIQQIKAALPNAVVIVLSPFWRNGVETWPTGLYAVYDGVKAAAQSFSDVLYVDVLDMPTDGSVSTTLAAATAAGANTITTNATVPERATIEIDTGANRERRMVTAVSGAAAPFTVAYGGNSLSLAHAAGVTVRTVGNCLWTGKGKVGATTGTGNSDLLVSNDGTHPSQAGHDALGLMVAKLVTAKLV